MRLAPGGRRVAGHDDRPLARLQHGRDGLAREVQQRSRIHPEVALEILWVELENAAAHRPQGVVHHHCRVAHPGPHAADGSDQRVQVRHVARKRTGAIALALELRKVGCVSRQHCHAIAAGGKAPGDLGAGSVLGSDAGHQADWRVQRGTPQSRVLGRAENALCHRATFGKRASMSGSSRFAMFIMK